MLVPTVAMVPVLLMVLTACTPTTGSAAQPDPRTTTADGALSGRLDVFAAASLTEAIDEIGRTFARRRPGLDVAVNTAGSSTLATQIVQGAPADVFVSADTAQMAVVEDAGLLAGAPVDVAGNRLAIAVEQGNPLGIEGLGDLSRSDVTAVLAAPEVPAGAYAETVLDAAGVRVDAASREPSVRAVLARVALGEADAGLVYDSDIAASDDVDGVGIPPDVNVAATYPAAVVAAGDVTDAARAFVDFLQGTAAQEILRAHGFTGP